jgi:transketolase
MRDALLSRIWEAMEANEDIFFVTADFGSPVLDKIRADFPSRFVNVGIAEQNLINVSTGLALEGFTVFSYAIAPFITMRCFEQIRVSLALLSEIRPMNVNLIGVGAGYSYVVSGPTHQCYEDIALMRALPNFQVLSPADHITTSGMFGHCIHKSGLKYLRLDAEVLPVIYDKAEPEISTGFYVHSSGAEVCLLATGYMLHTAIEVADLMSQEGVSIGVIDIFNITNSSMTDLENILVKYAGVVTLEEGFRGRGGLDSMLFDYTAQHNLALNLFNIGVEPGYSFELGSRSELHEKAGIGVQSVLKQVKNFLKLL